MSDDHSIVSVQESSELAIAPRHMGDRLEISAAHKRLLAMLPGATQLPSEVLWGLAQLAVAYRLDPFNGEIYASKMGKEKVGNQWQDKYAVMIGIKGFRVLAHRQSHYTNPPPRLMSDEEVKQFRRDLYDPGDVGVEFHLFRLDVARECKSSGVPYYPTIGRGFFRVKAKPERNDQGQVTGYKPDNIPETWTAYEVAEKRAEKSAITKAFDLRFDPDTFADEDQLDADMGDMAASRERATAITVRASKVEEEDNGDMIYAKP